MCVHILPTCICRNRILRLTQGYDMALWCHGGLRLGLTLSRGIGVACCLDGTYTHEV